MRKLWHAYWQQKAIIKTDNQLLTFQHIKQCVRQGCVISFDLFDLYSERIMGSLQDMPGILVSGNRVNNLRYADDTVLMDKNEI